MSFIHHSAAVHIPLALSVLFPISHLILVFGIRLGRLPKGVWLWHWGASGVQVATSYVSYLTGRRDGMFSAAAADILSQHWQLAYYFTIAWAAIFLIIPVVFRFRGGRSALPHSILLILLASQIWLAFRLGQLGGELVFGR